MEKVYGLWKDGWYRSTDGHLFQSHSPNGVRAYLADDPKRFVGAEVKEIGEDGLPADGTYKPPVDYKGLWENQNFLIEQIDLILETGFERDLLAVIQQLKKEADLGKMLVDLPVTGYAKRLSGREWYVHNKPVASLSDIVKTMPDPSAGEPPEDALP